MQARSPGGIRGQCLPNFFCDPPNFIVPRKICFKHTKNKSFTPENGKVWGVFYPQTLQPGNGPGAMDRRKRELSKA